jgi:carboxypeptidase C (cathepsin A)
VEAFTLGEYGSALAKGDELPAAERKAVTDKLVRYTGLDARYLDETNLRWDVSHFARELLRDRGLTIGRYDGRLTGPSGLNTGETAEYDPSSTLITPPFVSMFTNYLRNELNYRSDMFYYTTGGTQPWDYGVQNGFGDTTSQLRSAMTKNPYMKVMIGAAYFDLATPYFAAQYTFNHMGLRPEMHKNITWSYYPAGHMLYIDSDSHAKLKKDFSDFLAGALPKEIQ